LNSGGKSIELLYQAKGKKEKTLAIKRSALLRKDAPEYEKKKKTINAARKKNDIYALWVEVEHWSESKETALKNEIERVKKREPDNQASRDGREGGWEKGEGKEE